MVKTTTIYLYLLGLIVINKEFNEIFKETIIVNKLEISPFKQFPFLFYSYWTLTFIIYLSMFLYYQYEGFIVHLPANIGINRY